MEGFVRADIIKIKKDMEVIEKEIKELKDEFSIDNLRHLFGRLLTIIGNYCRHDCKTMKCSNCRIGRVISIIETKIAELERIRVLEMEFLKLFNEYTEYVIKEAEDDLKELEREVLGDE